MRKDEPKKSFLNRPKQIKYNHSNYQGFTLIEIIAALSIIAILASLSIPRFIDLSSNAAQKVFSTTVKELNSREFCEWANNQISDIGWKDDESLFAQIDFDLGEDFNWNPEAKSDGGTLHFKGHSIKLKRTPSTARNAGKWEIIY